MLTSRQLNEGADEQDEEEDEDEEEPQEVAVTTAKKVSVSLASKT